MQVIATAGHVDHGKSALVRALTGMEPDRWAEERRRGLTIDLGFAWMKLPGGERLAFVDVPGHERFVPNMLAGVGPVPAVLFVVAADGGWMPQSAEHLAAIDAVGIRHGLLAVTRSDLADPGPATRQAAEKIAASSLGPVESVAVSAVTGAGLAELRAALARLVASLPVPDAAAPVRLWVDRSFSIRGSGTVVTGTLPAGTVSTGQELLLTPSMRPARIRGIESLNEPVTSVRGVARVALNLRGIPADVPARGMALVDADRWTMTRLADVRLSLPRRLRLPQEMTLHIGSARTPARIRLLYCLGGTTPPDPPVRGDPSPRTPLGGDPSPRTPLGGDPAPRTPLGPPRGGLVWDVLRAVVSARVTETGRPALDIVDVGGGTGGLAVPFAALGHHVTVVDPSPDALAAAQRRAAEAGARLTSVQGEAASLDGLAGPAAADLIICHNVLEYVDSPADAMSAIARVLRPSAAVSVLASNAVAAVLHRALAGRFAEARALLASGAPAPGTTPRRFTLPELTALIEAAGLRVGEVHGLRIFGGLIPGALPGGDAAAADALRALEEAAASTPPLRDIASQLHVLGRR